ncbi:MAG: hypothetical protein VXZ71_05865, partial [SAR324 cluster bacterium]|nr:hypothetical protein [SAR324 cluster bacterium]
MGAVQEFRPGFWNSQFSLEALGIFLLQSCIIEEILSVVKDMDITVQHDSVRFIIPFGVKFTIRRHDPVQ